MPPHFRDHDQLPPNFSTEPSHFQPPGELPAHDYDYTAHEDYGDLVHPTADLLQDPHEQHESGMHEPHFSREPVYYANYEDPNDHRGQFSGGRPMPFEAYDYRHYPCEPETPHTYSPWDQQYHGHAYQPEFEHYSRPPQFRPRGRFPPPFSPRPGFIRPSYPNRHPQFPHTRPFYPTNGRYHPPINRPFHPRSMGPPRFDYEDQHYPPARDKDYRIHADPIGQLEGDVDELHTGAHDVDIRVKPAELFHTTSNAEPVDTGLFPAAFASTETRVSLGSSITPNASQGSLQSHHRICSARLPVPEHLMPAFGPPQTVGHFNSFQSASGFIFLQLVNLDPQSSSRGDTIQAQPSRSYTESGGITFTAVVGIHEEIHGPRMDTDSLICQVSIHLPRGCVDYLIRFPMEGSVDPMESLQLLSAQLEEIALPWILEHFLFSFMVLSFLCLEEAAASTGAWPPKGPEADQTEGGKKRVLPAWLRDELEKLEKKKAKELAVVSGDTAPDAERDAEGDIVMAADEDETKTGHLSEIPVKPLVDDDLSDDDEERGVDDDEEDVEVDTAVETSELAIVTAASRSKAVPPESASVTMGVFEGTADPDVSVKPTSPKMEGAVDRVIPEISHEYDKSGVKRVSSANLPSILPELSATPESSSALLSLEEFRAKFAALTDEEQQLETARFITRTLTDVLLAVTSEMILTVAQETLSAVQLEEEHKSKQPHGHDKPAVEVIAVPSGLAGLVAYNSDSDSESEQSELRKSQLADVADDAQLANSDVAETGICLLSTVHLLQGQVSSVDAKLIGHSRLEHDHPDSPDRRLSARDVSLGTDAHGNVGNSESRASRYHFHTHAPPAYLTTSRPQSRISITPRHSRDSLSPTSSSEHSKDRHRHRGHRKKSKSHQKSKRCDRSSSTSRSHRRTRSPSSSRRPSKRHHKRDHERSARRHRSRDSSSTSSSTNVGSCSSKPRKSGHSGSNSKRSKRHHSQTRRLSSNRSDSFQKSRRKKHQSDVSSSDISSVDAKLIGHSRLEHDHPDSPDRRLSARDVSLGTDAHGNVGNSESRASRYHFHTHAPPAYLTTSRPQCFVSLSGPFLFAA
ncbi:hypothetical protein AHF37_05131 [Paragonimus kellicotti]|nr:hypothetical protein AHF37_05131 [Paragonimus kellicotti]